MRPGVFVATAVFLLAARLCSTARLAGEHGRALQQQSEGVHPSVYRSVYPAPSRDRGSLGLTFHWVISACDTRRQAGRLLSTTLLSAWLHDLRPHGISISWCKPYNKTRVPSLFYNLRHSHKINFFFMSPALMNKSVSARVTASALLIPQLLGVTDMPMLWTEDDVLFLPYAHARMASAVASIPLPASHEDWLLFLYNPGEYGQAFGEWPQPVEDDEGHRSFAMHSNTRADAVAQMPLWGVQGLLLNPGMWRLLNTAWLPLMLNGTLSWYNSDAALEHFFKRHHCKNHKGMTAEDHIANANATCHIFMTSPSLVQHTGIMSSLYGKEGGQLSKLFHMAKDFPMRVRLPAFDSYNSDILDW